ncbi:hypothetical protein ACH5RR_022089 [Cinchona calisaya]|uniref:BURP domain-containing protein n=1 Tax=Cinchona calisaya TaxID=153742 RepID=A0ABD2Z6T8_9GENT
MRRADMAAGLNSCIFFFLALIFLQCFCGSRAREIADRHGMQMQQTKDSNNYIQNQLNGMLGKHEKDLAVNVFFNEEDLKLGNKIPIYFPIKGPSAKPPLLSREQADSIPFSSSKLPYLLQLFSFSKDSPQANAMADTLSHCEFKPGKGEIKFCATSLESMLDSALNVFGSKTPFKVLTTNHLKDQTTSILQNYTIQDEPKVISSSKMVACHTMSYPYAVYYCHSQESDTKLFKVLLLGENGNKVDAMAICHMDTSDWDPNHVAFCVLKSVPGRSSPVCHFFPADHLVWVASTSAL